MRFRRHFRIIPIFFVVFLLGIPGLYSQGHFEFGFHFGRWGINFAESIVSDGIENIFPDVLEDLAKEHDDDLEQRDFYLDNFTFESGRNNWGFEVRWYPGGWGRSFSLGFSIERTSIRIASDISARLEMESFEPQGNKPATFNIQANGQVEMNPTSYHFHFRWDIFPLARIRPFFTFGVGLAGKKFLQEARLTASLTGELQIQDEETVYYDESENRTLQEIEDDFILENEKFIPSIFPFIQLNFGIKGEITRNLCLFLETGIFNGFILREGIAFRI